MSSLSQIFFFEKLKIYYLLKFYVFLIDNKYIIAVTITPSHHMYNLDAIK